MAEVTNVDICDLTRDVVVTVKVRKLKRFRFRFWLMSKLLVIAAWVAPVRMEIENSEG